MDGLQTRDEAPATVQSRLQQLGVTDDLSRLQGWQRRLVFESIEQAHTRDLSDHANLSGAAWLSDVADVYEHRDKLNDSDRLMIDVLRRAATGFVHA
jgi:hypothetical protein